MEGRAYEAAAGQVRSIQDLHPFRQGTYRGSGYSAQNLEYDRIHIDNTVASVLRRIALNDLDTFVEAEIAVPDRVKELGLTEKSISRRCPSCPLPPFASA